MNKRILALLLSLITVLCQSTLCFGEDLIDTEVYAEDSAALAAVEVVEGSEFVVSGDVWNEFTVKNATYSVEGGVAKFVADKNKKGNNEYITAATEMPVGSYDEFTIKIKYTNVATPTSNAIKDNGFYIPRIKVELECSVDGGVQKNEVLVSAVTGDSTQTYTTADYVEVTGKLSDMEGYGDLTATKINIYPVYGFKKGTAEIESITVKPAAATEEPEQPDTTDDLVWNFDSEAEVTQWASSNASQVKLSYDANGYMKYVSTVTTSSGWMTTPVEFPGAKYNKLKFRAKINNYTATTVSAALDAAPFLEMYYSCINASGESQGPKGGYSVTASYNATLGIDNLYSTDWAEYELDLTKLKGWSDAQTITQLRLDVAKNASGTVYLDYIRLCYEEPVVEPEPPVVEPDEPDEPDGPVDEPDTPAAPVTDGEQWYSNYFDTEADAAQWVANSKSQASVTWVEGGYMKFVSTPTTNANGGQQSGWATTKVAFGKNQYYRMNMRVKLENCSVPFSGGATPFFTIYYMGTNAAGATQNYSSSFAINLKYQYEEGEDGLFYSDWVDYEIDLGSIPGWSTMNEVAEFRIDFIKNGAGTIYLDYINFLSLPAVSTLTYNDIEQADMTKVPVDAKTIEAYVSQPFNAITKNDISIYEKPAEGSDERVEVEISKVAYTASTGKIAVTLGGEMLSNTDYVFEIKDTAMVNSKQTLYRPIAKEFRTDASAFEIEASMIDANSAKVTYINTGARKNVIAIATAWNGTQYVGKVIAPVEAKVGNTDVTLDYSGLGGDKVEIVTWEFVNGVPKAYGKKVFEFTR